ncbi:MAG: YHS domain-containing protein [Nitrospirota bacterium]
MKKLLLAISVLSLAAVISPAWADAPKQCTKGTCGMEEKEAAKGTAVDPVCGMDIAVKDAQYQEKYNGNTYYFCSAKCKKAFDKNPSKFTQKKK